MRKTRIHRSPRRKAASTRHMAPSTAALRKRIRPIVEELVAKKWEELEARLDAQDAREALAEPGSITHEDLVRKLKS